MGWLGCLSVWLLFRIPPQRSIQTRLGWISRSRVGQALPDQNGLCEHWNILGPAEYKPPEQQRGRAGEVQLGVFLEARCGFFVLVDFSQREQQILLSANHQGAPPSAFYLRPPQPGNSFAASLSSSSAPEQSPGTKLFVVHTRDNTEVHSPRGKKSGLSSEEKTTAGAETPHLLISPCPGVSGNPHCAPAARVSTPGSADGAGEQSRSPPSLPRPSPRPEPRGSKAKTDVFIISGSGM